MKKFNSMITAEDYRVGIPSTHVHARNENGEELHRNHSHERNTNMRNNHHRADTSFAQVNFTGEALKPLDHRSKNPRTWEF
jgi:hypothetical protein